MKTLFFRFMVLALILSAIGCGRTKTNPQGTPAKPAHQKESTEVDKNVAQAEQQIQQAASLLDKASEQFKNAMELPAQAATQLKNAITATQQASETLRQQLQSLKSETSQESATLNQQFQNASEKLLAAMTTLQQAIQQSAAQIKGHQPPAQQSLPQNPPATTTPTPPQQPVPQPSVPSPTPPQPQTQQPAAPAQPQVQQPPEQQPPQPAPGQTQPQPGPAPGPAPAPSLPSAQSLQAALASPKFSALQGNPLVTSPVGGLFAVYLVNPQSSPQAQTAGVAVVNEIFNEPGREKVKIWILQNIIKVLAETNQFTALDQSRVKDLESEIKDVAYEQEWNQEKKDLMIMGTMALGIAVVGGIERPAGSHLQDEVSALRAFLRRKESPQGATAAEAESGAAPRFARREARSFSPVRFKAQGRISRLIKPLSPQKKLFRTLRALGLNDKELSLIRSRLAREVDLGKMKGLLFHPTNFRDLEYTAIRFQDGDVATDAAGYIVFKIQTPGRLGWPRRVSYLQTHSLSNDELEAITEKLLYAYEQKSYVELMDRNGSVVDTQIPATAFEDEENVTIERDRDGNVRIAKFRFNKTRAAQTFIVTSAIFGGGYLLARAHNPGMRDVNLRELLSAAQSVSDQAAFPREQQTAPPPPTSPSSPPSSALPPTAPAPSPSPMPSTPTTTPPQQAPSVPAPSGSVPSGSAPSGSAPSAPFLPTPFGSSPSASVSTPASLFFSLQFNSGLIPLHMEACPIFRSEASLSPFSIVISKPA